MIDAVSIVENFKDHKVLDNVTFNVKDGETLVNLGPNGAGKLPY